MLVPSSMGAQLVYTVPGSEATQSIDLIDIASGERRHLVTLDVENSMSWAPSTLRLPPDWVLFAMQLGDFPISGFPRPVPLLLNIVTGEQIELVNLPHSQP